jgi:hypothetical protein
MISEIDIRDWEKVDFKTIEKVLEDGTYLNPNAYMWDFIQQVRDVMDGQVRTTQKQIPALFRKGEE